MAPGCGAFSHEFLAALGELMDDEDVNLLGMAYFAGDLPSCFYLVWHTLHTDTR